jgi:hypothetical protein
MKAAWIVLPALLLAAGSAQSMEIYCRADHARIHDGGEYQVNWQVVNAHARRPQLPGQTKATTGCNFNWNSLGGFHRPAEILQAPKLGHARVLNNYRIFYESARNGQDAFAIRVHWIQYNSGSLQSAIVRYNVTVTDQPL